VATVGISCCKEVEFEAYQKIEVGTRTISKGSDKDDRGGGDDHSQFGKGEDSATSEGFGENKQNLGAGIEPPTLFLIH